jgi:hypothetical protein
LLGRCFAVMIPAEVVVLTRPARVKPLVTSLIALVLLGASLVPPGSAHDSTSVTHNWRRHYRPLAKQIFYRKATADARFVNVGEQVSDAALLDGMDASAFATAMHAHSGDDITSGTVGESRVAAALARDAEVFGIVTAADGATSGLDADLLDGQTSADFADASHAHSGDDITSGTVGESVIDVLIARVADVFDIVLAADGAASGLDADLLDGLTSADFALAGGTEAAQWFKEADTVATTTTSERVVLTAPEGITITGIRIEPAAAVTASDANYATLTIARRDAAGGNKATVGTLTTQTGGGGGSGNWTAFSTISVGSLANTSLAPGQKLTIEITKTGLGVTLPVLAVQVEYTVS